MKQIIITLNALITIILLTITLYLNILPIKYLILLILLLLTLNISGIISIYIKKKIVKLIASLIYIIITLISLITIKYEYNTIHYLKKGFNNNNIEINSYNVVVLKSSKYNNLEDLENKKIGYLKNELDNNEYLQEIKIKTDNKDYKNIYDLYEDLLNKKIQAIIVNETYLDLLEDNYENINEKIKIIYSFKIEEKKQQENKKTELKPINIYISGSDSRSGLIETNTRTDVNMIMTINPKTKKILLTSIPRDYYVRLHNTSGYKDKLTHSGIYGIEMSKKTIEDLFNIKIDYTIKVGFQSVIKIVDLIDGIDINSEYEFITHCGDGGAEKTYVKKGMNHFNGAQALSYSRERYAYTKGDNQRILNQQQVLEATIEKIIKDKSLIVKYDKFLDSFKELYRTDIPDSLIKLYIKEQLKENKTWTIKKQVVTGTGTLDITYSMPGRKLYVMIPNMESVKEATESINKIKDE